MSGDLVGTLRYMSPEQALAKRVVIDHRTDVYSLGATLYELLTLEPPYSGNDRQEVLRQIAFEEPRSLRRVERAVPAELEVIILKALEKNPAERYGTAQELADDLRRWLEDRPIQARRPSWSRRVARWARRHRAAVAAGVASLLLALVLLAISNLLIWRAKQATDEALKLSKLHEQEVNNLLANTAALQDRSQAKLQGALAAMDRLLSETEKEGPLPAPVADQALAFYESVLPLDRDARGDQQLMEDAHGFHESVLPLDRDAPLVRGSPEWYWELAWAHVHLGNLYALHGQFDNAAAAYDDACRRIQFLATFSGPGRKPLFQNRPAVEAEFRRALSRCKRPALKWWLDIPDYRIALADSLEKLRAESGAGRDAAEAPDPLRLQMIELLEHVVTDLPTLKHRCRLIRAYQEYGDSLRHTGDSAGPGTTPLVRNSAEARALYVRALVCGEQWEADPELGKQAAKHIQAAEHFINQLHALADTFIQINAQDEAGRALRSAWKLCLRQDEENPQGSALDLLTSAGRYADFLRRADRPDEARDVDRQTLARMERRIANLAKERNFLALGLSPFSVSVGGVGTVPCDGVVLGLLSLGGGLHDLDAPADAERAYRAALSLSEQIFDDNPGRQGTLGLSENALAWFLATCAEPRRRDSVQAALLAGKAVELLPDYGEAWNTLGVARYCNGDPKAAVEALNRSVELRKGGDACDFFFLAMARWQLGDKDEAGKWYDQAVAWMDKNKPQDKELRRFRAEATDLLRIKEQAPSRDGEAPPRKE
jgi:hypothetical protein